MGNINWENIDWTNVYMIIGYILIGISIVFPTIILFSRTIFRLSVKRESWGLNRSLRISWFIGSFVFIAGFILIALKLFSII